MLMEIHVQAASKFATSVVALACRDDRIDSSGKIGCIGQLLEPFDTAVKLALTVGSRHRMQAWMHTGTADLLRRIFVDWQVTVVDFER